MRCAVMYELSADATCITLRPKPSARQLPQKGFGMVKVQGPHVPVDWDAASLKDDFLADLSPLTEHARRRGR